jgi:hypothetical protein
MPLQTLLHSNDPSGTPLSGTPCLTGRLVLAHHSSQFFLLSFIGSIDLLLYQKVEPGVSSVVESTGAIVHFPFFLRLLLSCLAPSRRLDLMNGFDRDHSALGISSVSGIDQSLWIDLGSVDLIRVT